jgi:hypothetical protein
MLKKTLMIALLCTLSASTIATAQINSNKLAFIIPDLFGPGGLTLPNVSHEAHFNSAFQNNFEPFNTAIASQLTLLPIPSPASGFTYTFDRALGVYSRSAQSFGPILTERAETIGKNRFALGFSYQHFNYESIDGLDLNKVPAVFQHLDVEGDNDFEKDVITTDNSIEVRASQYTSFFSVGLTDWLDLSIAIPFVSTDLRVSSNATIQRIGSTDPFVHSFDPNTPTTKRLFTSSGSASGLGDVMLRLKGTAKKWEHAGIALGTDLRLPTGDELDFLGSGAVGVKPFVVFSYSYKRLAPHINLGYEWNGKTVLAGNVTTGAKESLPNQFVYAGGMDIGFTEKFTMALDILGQQLIRAKRVSSTTFTAADGETFPQVRFTQNTFNQTSGAIGFKMNATGKLLVSFNALFRLNHAGLRHKVSPLIGVAYSF